jgi:hypothetical protein
VQACLCGQTISNGTAAAWDAANAVAVDGSGNVIVTGWSQTTTKGVDGDFVTIKYSAISPPAVHLTIVREGGSGYFIRYTGAAGLTYRLQRAASVTGPWSNLAANTAPTSGLIEYHERIHRSARGFTARCSLEQLSLASCRRR